VKDKGNKEVVNDRGRVIRMFQMIAAAIITIGALIGATYGGASYIDSRVVALTSSDEYLAKVSARVRPSCIFNNKGSILVDMGAMALIEDISLTNYCDTLPSTIIIRPRRHLQNAPVITTIDPFTLLLTESRGNKHEWVYQVKYALAPLSDDPVVSIRFRLEIIY